VPAYPALPSQPSYSFYTLKVLSNRYPSLHPVISFENHSDAGWRRIGLHS
jgi:hypothetical protein